MRRILQKLANCFIVYRVDVAGKYANQPRPNWGMTILALAIISIVILLCVLARLNPLPPEAYPQPHPIP